MRPGQRGMRVRMALSAVVAYAFVLQILLGSIVVTQMAASGPASAFALCAGGDHPPVDPAGKPADRVTPATCVLCAFASFAPPIPAAITIALRIAPDTLLQSTPSDSDRGMQRREPRSSRGPPRIA